MPDNRDQIMLEQVLKILIGFFATFLGERDFTGAITSGGREIKNKNLKLIQKLGVSDVQVQKLA